MLLFLKFLAIQRGWNWLNFYGHVHLGTRSREVCVLFHGSLSFESYGWIPEIYVNWYAEALRWKLGDAPSNFMSWTLKFWHVIWNYLMKTAREALFRFDIIWRLTTTIKIPAKSNTAMKWAKKKRKKKELLWLRRRDCSKSRVKISGLYSWNCLARRDIGCVQDSWPAQLVWTDFVPHRTPWQ